MSKTNNPAADRIEFGASQIEEKIAHYPEDLHQPILWIAEYIRIELNSSLSRFMLVVNAAGVQGSQNTWYQIITGKYFRNSKSHQNWIDAMRAIRDYVQHGALANGKLPFIETSTWHMVEDYIDAMRAPENICRLGIVVSDTGTQKTCCLSQYAMRNNHGTTVRFEAPAKPVLNKLLYKWLECYTPRKSFSNNAAAERELRVQLNSKKVVIIENAQRLYLPNRGANQELFSFIQEIQEDTGCIIILSWTRGFTRDFLAGSERDFFEQFVGRVGGVDQILSLPEKMPVKDLRLIAKTLKIEDVENALPILKEWAKAEGKCRVLFHKLQKAKRYAEAEGSDQIQIDHLEQASAKPQNSLDLNLIKKAS